ncbi:hypothetical protein R1sor_005719 [Riccia sorocarpa]|uniref:Dehydrin 2 n=1 Tax=Riccia sorocarpa TaxID=122646 RepID=A0ABD3HL09_9MARC
MAGYLGGTIQQTRDENENLQPADSRNPGEFLQDPLETLHIGGREPPTSKVGYGGGHPPTELGKALHGQEASSSLEGSEEGKVHGGRYVGGEGSTEEPVSSGERPKPKYELCHSNSFPREAGIGEVPAGGYQEEGGCSKKKIPVTQKSQHYDESQPSQAEQYDYPTPVRPPGAVLLDENHFDGPKYEPTVAGDASASPGGLQEGEVRGGVPHAVVSGQAFGAGQDNDGKGVVSGAPGSSAVGYQGLPPQEYQQTGESGQPAYSQQYAQPHGPDEHVSQLEGTDQSPKPTGVPGEDSHSHEKGGLLSKIKNHLPGHNKES